MTPEQKREYHRLYRIRNRTRLTEYNRAWAAAHPDSEQRRRVEWNRNNRERINQQQREWAAAHPDAVKRHNETFRKNNREHIRQYRAEWRRRNPEKDFTSRAKRFLRIEATIEGETAIADFIKLVRKSRQIACYYCGNQISGKSAHIDHMIPLSRGGSHTPDNLCAACPHCNVTKRSRLIAEWKPVGQQVLAL